MTDQPASDANPPTRTSQTKLPAWIVGHRGARAMAPENSLDGFGWAIDHGVQAVELDVRLTADDVLVCVHDETLAAYGGPPGLIRQADAVTITRSPLTGGVRVPTLAEVLDLAEGHLAINVEVKNHAEEASFDGQRRSALVLATLLSDRADAGHVDQVFAVSSFDPESVVAFTDCASPFADTGALLTPPGRPINRILDGAAALGVTAVHPHHTSLLSSRAIPRLQDAGLTVRTWTVNSRRLAQRLRGAGVESIVTDDPLRLVTR